MRYEPEKARQWMRDTEAHLPGFYQQILQLDSELLLIGAGVFELYANQGWMPPLKRKTGDLDLSIGLIGDAKAYEVLVTGLKDLGYSPDEDHPYRHHSPKKIPGGPTYVDVLAHPAEESVSESVARSAMGVGPGFSLSGMSFAKTESFIIEKKILFPNPFGQIFLKSVSYFEEPVRRRKDLADIIELVCGLVEKGAHFDMPDLWQKLSSREEAKSIYENLDKLTGDVSTEWDVYEAEGHLKERGFSDSDIENLLPERILEFLAQFKKYEP